MKTSSVICKQCGVLFEKSIYEINRFIKLGKVNHFCSNKCSCSYNINLNVNVLPLKRQEEYNKNPKICACCKSIIPYNKRHSNVIYCSHKCAATHGQKDGGRCHWSPEDKLRLKELSKKNPYFNGTLKSDLSEKVEKINKICPICNIKFSVYPFKIKQICCSKKCSVKWVHDTGYMKGKSGGYRAKGGRGKQGWYKGYYCNSSWELAWVIYNLEHNVLFVRNTKGFEYEFEDRKFKFYPDFILKESGEYVEIKAYIDKKNAAKISSFPYKLDVIGKKDIIPFIDYVEKKYGKDYIKLYESKESSKTS